MFSHRISLAPTKYNSVTNTSYNTCVVTDGYMFFGSSLETEFTEMVKFGKKSSQ